MRKAAHGALEKVSGGIERLHFNVCLAHIREFANCCRDVSREGSAPDPAAKTPADVRWAVREAALILVQLFSPMMPHLAEECWQLLGQQGLVSEADGRKSNPICWWKIQ